jgi:hypothetical protein
LTQFLMRIELLSVFSRIFGSRGTPSARPRVRQQRRFSPHPQPRPRDDEKWAKATEEKG